MSCGAGPSRRAHHAVKRRGRNRRVSQGAHRKVGTRTTTPTKRKTHGFIRQILKDARRPQHKRHQGKRSKASLTASATARRHAHATASATASAHARATARAHARARALARARAAARLQAIDRRKAQAARIACLKKARKSAVSKSGTVPGRHHVWRPSFRGHERRRWKRNQLW